MALFQTIDDKSECIAVYINNKLVFNKIPKTNLSTTWDYSVFLKDIEEVEYAKLFCEGKSLDQACPKHLETEWLPVFNKLKAFYRSAREAQLDLNKYCFYELIPEHFIIEYCVIKNKITNYIFKNYKRPVNYNFLVSLTKLVTDIKYKKLNIDLSELKTQRHKLEVRNFIQKINKIEPHIKYNIFGTKTGRLSTIKNSFPALTMNKNYRSVLKPQNDLFIEFDYNAAELRVMLALLDKEQPQEDLHEWNLKHVYRGVGTREKAKKRIFAWLYNPESKDYLSSRSYDRDLLLQKYWDGTHVRTIYDRKIEADKHHALNYIIQSTFADLFLRQAIKVHELLKNKKSFISLLIHDSLVIDFSESEKNILPELKKILMDTKLGKFKISSSAGKDFGSMERFNI